MAILDNKKRGLYAKEVKNSSYICPLSAQSPRSSALLFYADSCESCSVLESILHKSVLFAPGIVHDWIFW